MFIGYPIDQLIDIHLLIHSFTHILLFAHLYVSVRYVPSCALTTHLQLDFTIIYYKWLQLQNA